MARPKPALINALKKAARKLQHNASYQWGHMGSCNCGHLVQEVTQLSKAEIHEYAMQTRGGDWSEQSLDYCPTSGYLMDQMISIMLDAGLDIADFKHLERLSDPEILKLLPAEERNLRHNHRDDVIKYMNAWAAWLEEKLVDEIQISELHLHTEKI